MTTFIISERFNGPPSSANGGYACGCLAAFVQRPSQIRLQAPPPLDTPIEVTEATGGATARVGSTEVAVARSATLEWQAPPSPSVSAARAGRSRYAGYENHYLPSCFVCGPDRKDGLRIFAGRVDGRDVVAADWEPAQEFVADGAVDSKIVWAALDCPAIFGADVPMDKKYLLGQMTGDIRADIPGDRTYVVYAWRTELRGRKCMTAAALADETGQVWARAEHIWIEVATI